MIFSFATACLFWNSWRAANLRIFSPFGVIVSEGSRYCVIVGVLNLLHHRRRRGGYYTSDAKGSPIAKTRPLTGFTLQQVFDLVGRDFGHGGQYVRAMSRSALDTVPMVDVAIAGLLVEVELERQKVHTSTGQGSTDAKVQKRKLRPNCKH